MSSAQLAEQQAPPPSSVSPLDGPPRPAGSGGFVRKVLVVLVIAAAVGAAAWKIHANSQSEVTMANRMAQAADRPSPVMVVAVQRKAMPIFLSALGTVTPYYSVTIKSRVDGQLMSVDVREGQSVRKGQLLAQIDPRPYNAVVGQAEGQLIKDQANAKNADAEAQRYTALLSAGVVSKESQQSQISTAGQAEGAIAADQAAIDAAKVNVAYTRITSPIDGVVGLRQVDPGNIVHAADTTGLLLVTQLQPITVIFTLPEDQLPQVLDLVRKGQKLSVEAYDRSNSAHLASGTLLTLDNSIDPTTGTDKVKAVFANRDGALFPNQFVNVRLILQERQNAIVVPAAAIQTGSQGDFVYVVKPGNPPGGPRTGGGRPVPAANTGETGAATEGAATDDSGRGHSNSAPYYVVSQPVTVDLTEGDQVIVASGVNAGDQVVVDGQEKLVNLSKVIPKTQTATPTPPRPVDGTNSTAFGPGRPGPSDPISAEGKAGMETGAGVRPAGIRGAEPGRPLSPGLHRGQNGPRR